MNTFQTLEGMAPSIMAGNAANGFWKDGKDRNQEEAVMLILTELAEAVEANRKPKAFIDTCTDNDVRNAVLSADYDIPEEWKAWFEVSIKDSIADEISDTVIRLLDCAHGFNWVLYERDYRKESSGNFAEDMLQLCRLVIRAKDNFPECDWGYVLSAIIKFCEWNKIDIVQHVQWKLKFNKMRGAMHGGKKY